MCNMESIPNKILELELTLECNFRCDYCTNGRNDVLERPIPEGDLSAIERCVKEFDSVYIYGGEPTMSPRIDDVVKMLTTMGKPYVIQTNLSLTNKIEALVHIDPSVSFQVSIHRTQPGHKKTLSNIFKFRSNITQCDIMFVSMDDLKLYYKLKPLLPNLRLVPVADFATDQRTYLSSLCLYNKLRKIFNDVSFDDDIRSFVWEAQFNGDMSPRGKPCPCIKEYFQMDPAGNLHHCPQRYDGIICPFNSCFNIDTYEI